MDSIKEKMWLAQTKDRETKANEVIEVNINKENLNNSYNDD